MKNIIDALSSGRSITMRPSGHSMTPRINHRDLIRIDPLKPEDEIKKGDVVACKVNGRFMLHLVTAIKGGQYQISNNHGHVNGWTKTIYGKVIRL